MSCSIYVTCLEAVSIASACAGSWGRPGVMWGFPCPGAGMCESDRAFPFHLRAWALGCRALHDLSAFRMHSCRQPAACLYETHVLLGYSDTGVRRYIAGCMGMLANRRAMYRGTSALGSGDTRLLAYSAAAFWGHMDSGALGYQVTGILRFKPIPRPGSRPRPRRRPTRKPTPIRS